MPKSFKCFVWRGKVTGAGKTQITQSVTLAFTAAFGQLPEAEEVAQGATVSLAAEWLSTQTDAEGRILSKTGEFGVTGLHHVMRISVGLKTCLSLTKSGRESMH